MADTQLYAHADGTVREYVGWKAPSLGVQNEVLARAFSSNGRFPYDELSDEGGLHRTKLNFMGRERVIAYVNRSVCGGGRPATRPQELRVQIQPEVYNRIVQQNQAGKLGLLIGVYVIEDDAMLAVWRPTVLSTGSGSASKQVDAEVVARAMQLGYEMQVYPDGETSIWVGRPELFLAYLDYLELDPPKDNDIQKSQRDEQGLLQRNLIYFGAPGTGKSYKLAKDAEAAFGEDKTRRVTFHPDYTYAQFVGSFKPYVDPKNGDKITYKYITGPFLDTYLEAITHPENDYVLIIEELNRANPAAVFGNVFQLLDRGVHGNSEYSVATQLEMRDCIGEYFDNLNEKERNVIERHYDDVGFDDIREMSMQYLNIPSNMSIWATMNSADQGVYPMDTAFKRRWDFEYLGLDDEEEAVKDFEVPDGDTGRKLNWNELRKAINRKLQLAKVNEDKLLGPFFISPEVLADPDNFNSVFKGKVLLYLYEDAAKIKRKEIFKDDTWTYSEIRDIYDTYGVKGVFGELQLSGNDNGVEGAENVDTEIDSE